MLRCFDRPRVAVWLGRGGLMLAGLGALGWLASIWYVRWVSPTGELNVALFRGELIAGWALTPDARLARTGLSAGSSQPLWPRWWPAFRHVAARGATASYEEYTMCLWVPIALGVSISGSSWWCSY